MTDKEIIETYGKSIWEMTVEEIIKYDLEDVWFQLVEENE